MRLTALHHVTCVCSDARQTVRFYRELGMRLVKKTVNFDDPGSYHLYFGDERGGPGTLLTFFEWPQAGPGRLGWGTLDTLALTVPSVSEVQRLEDPDGLRLELHPGEPGIDHVVAYAREPLYAELVESGQLRFAEPPEEHVALVGAGITHHIAWRVPDGEEQLRWRRHLAEHGFRPTQVMDRKYFRSIYFRMPDGLLLEIATDEPGFAVDEPAERLGESLALPDWLESSRGQIERHLAPI